MEPIEVQVLFRELKERETGKGANAQPEHAQRRRVGWKLRWKQTSFSCAF
jgi:hypothetical protein